MIPHFAPRSRATLRTALAAPLSSALVALAGAPAAQAQPLKFENLPPARMAQIESICHSVMGLSPGERHYVDCAMSLSHSAYKLDRVRGMQAARGDCLAKGLKPGDLGLSECELSVVNAGVTPVVEPVVAPAAAPVRSLFSVSAREARNREQQACARIGYDPVYGPFADCVSNLQSALFAADHPMN